jgi:hypothetical protein
LTVEYIQGFRTGCRGGQQRDGWSATKLAGYTLGAMAYMEAQGFSKQQAEKASKMHAKRSSRCADMPRHVPRHMPEGMPEACHIEQSNNRIIETTNDRPVLVTPPEIQRRETSAGNPAPEIQRSGSDQFDITSGPIRTQAPPPDADGWDEFQTPRKLAALGAQGIGSATGRAGWQGVVDRCGLVQVLEALAKQPAGKRWAPDIESACGVRVDPTAPATADQFIALAKHIKQGFACLKYVPIDAMTKHLPRIDYASLVDRLRRDMAAGADGWDAQDWTDACEGRKSAYGGWELRPLPTAQPMTQEQVNTLLEKP